MAWGGALPTNGADAEKTRSLHWDGGEDDGREALELNLDRGLFMYTWLGGWYKSFGIDGDDLPNMCACLFGADKGTGLCGMDLATDVKGNVWSIHCLAWPSCEMCCPCNVVKVCSLAEWLLLYTRVVLHS